jgi:hypothetical protein
MDYYNINVVCSCGGFGSQLNFIISWLYAVDNKGHNLNFQYLNSCKFGHCDWKKLIYDSKYNFFTDFFELIEFPKQINYKNFKNNSDKRTKIKNSVLYTSWKNVNSEFNCLELDIYNKNINFNIINDEICYHEQHFNKLRNKINYIIQKYLKPQNWLNQKISNFNFQNKDKYIIGIHIRSSQHYKLEKKYSTLDIAMDYIQEIKNLNLSNYKIFLATHMKQIVLLFQTIFGKDKIIFIDTLRSSATIRETNLKQLIDNDWTKENNNIKKYGIKKYLSDIYLDIVMLSKCNLIIGGPSNIFWLALMMNPEVKFIIPKILSKTNSR